MTVRDSRDIHARRRSRSRLSSTSNITPINRHYPRLRAADGQRINISSAFSLTRGKLFDVGRTHLSIVNYGGNADIYIYTSVVVVASSAELPARAFSSGLATLSSFQRDSSPTQPPLLTKAMASVFDGAFRTEGYNHTVVKKGQWRSLRYDASCRCAGRFLRFQPSRFTKRLISAFRGRRKGRYVEVRRKWNRKKWINAVRGQEGGESGSFPQMVTARQLDGRAIQARVWVSYGSVDGLLFQRREGRERSPPARCTGASCAIYCGPLSPSSATSLREARTIYLAPAEVRVPRPWHRFYRYSRNESIFQRKVRPGFAKEIAFVR